MIPIPIGIIWGFFAFICWGLGDYFGKLYSDHAGGYRTALYLQFIGILPPMFVFIGQLALDKSHPSIDWSTWAILTPVISILIVLTYITYYQGLQKGKVAIVTTVSAAWLPVAVILANIFLSESLSLQQWSLIGIVTIGTLLLGVHTSPQFNRQSTGFWYGFVTIFSIAIIVNLLKPLTQASGVIIALVSTKLVATVCIWILIRLRKTPSYSPSYPQLSLIVAAGLLDSCGYIFYTLGLSMAPVFLISPLAAGSPIITMCLARLLIRERVSRIQGVGIAITVGSIIFLSAISNS